MIQVKTRFIIIASIVAIIFTFTLIRHYLQIPQEKYIKRLPNIEKLIKDGLKTQAVYDTVYSELRKGGQILQITINYTYTVNGKKYTNESHLSKPPQKMEFEITYLPDNPNVHSFSPQGELEQVKNLISTENEAPTTSWVMLSISIITIIYLIMSIKKDKFSVLD